MNFSLLLQEEEEKKIIPQYQARKAASWFPSDSSGHALHSSLRYRSYPYCFQQQFPDNNAKKKQIGHSRKKAKQQMLFTQTYCQVVSP